MSLADIKLNSTAKRGFTIVELLIVVVVIAILAAITIVSYNGITTKANASAAKSVAATWQKKIELYQAEEGRYPLTAAEMSANSAKSWHITSGSLIPTGATALTADTGKTRSLVVSCSSDASAPTTSTVSGVRISYWNYEAASPNPVEITVGACTGAGRSPAASWNVGPAAS